MRDNEGLLAAYGIKGCGCWACVEEVVSKRPFPDNLRYPFVVCETCGNKRCPHATWHENECTGSNKSGQSGSRYAVAASETGEQS